MGSMSLHTRRPHGQPSPGLDLELRCDFPSIRQGAESLRIFLKAHGFPEKDVWACELSFVEACNNIVQHSPSRDYARPLSIQVSCRPAEVELQIRDESPGFDFPESADLPSGEAERGRGLFLIRSLMHQVEYVRGEGRNRLTMKRKITGL